ncbi:MAG: N-acetylmuramoyl-L-alanine amidase [Flavipsychrobacter sp.]
MQVFNADSGEKAVNTSAGSHLNAWLIASLVYLLGSFILFVFLLRRVVFIYRLKHRHKVVAMAGFDMVKVNSSSAPFSFFNTLYWREGMPLDSATGQIMLQHELVHIRQKHTLDKLFMQLCLIVFWINPIFWFMQHELSQLHEFVADNGAIEDGDTDAFARMLLQAHYGNTFPDIVHSFFYSPVKRRLTMLSNTNHTKFAHLRRFMAFPLMAGATFLFSFAPKKDMSINRAQKQVLLVLDAGHGGNDNGAVHNDYEKEKDINLRITNRLAELAGEYNIRVIPTRKGDEYPTLQQRVNISNGAHADVFVSIHVNDHRKDNDKNDYEMYISDQNGNFNNSRLLASAIAANMKGAGIDMVLNSDKHLWVLSQNQAPAVLIECGEVNNPTEMAHLKDDKQLDAFCRQVLSGIVNFENNRK